MKSWLIPLISILLGGIAGIYLAPVDAAVLVLVLLSVAWVLVVYGVGRP